MSFEPKVGEKWLIQLVGQEAVFTVEIDDPPWGSALSENDIPIKEFTDNNGFPWDTVWRSELLMKVPDVP